MDKATKSDEEITLDFSSIKKLFSKGKQEGKTESKEFFKKTSTYTAIFLIIFVLGLSVYIRTLPDGLPIAEDLSRNSL